MTIRLGIKRCFEHPAAGVDQRSQNDIQAKALAEALRNTDPISSNRLRVEWLTTLP